MTTPQPGNGRTAREGAPQQLRNSAFVFIKPHACNNVAVQHLVQGKLESVPSMKILATIDLSSSRIDDKKIIDRHYNSIASKAVLNKPNEISNFPATKFESFFQNERWSSVLSYNRVVNAQQAMERFKCSPEELEQAWREAEQEKKIVKLGGGFYVGLLAAKDSNDKVYVINGFYMAMREKYVQQGVVIRGYEVEWDPSQLSWSQFRSEVLGATDPKEAAEGSLRQMIFSRYEELGLEKEPDKGDNGVHGSASPLEGLAERVNWMEKSTKDDRYGRALLAQGLTDKLLREEYFLDPVVKLPPGGAAAPRQSLFDAVEDMDAQPCLDMLVGIYDVQLNDAQGETGCTCSVM